MTIRLTCSCGQALAAKDELRGKTVRCPKWGNPLKIPAGESPLGSEVPGPAPGPPPGAAEIPPALPPGAARPAPGLAAPRRGWTYVEVGLSIAWFSLLAGGIGYAILALVALVAVNDPLAFLSFFGGATAGRLVVLILFWSMLAVLATYVSMVTGWFLCRPVPREAGARVWIHSARGCVGAAVGVLVLGQIISMFMAPAFPTPPGAGEMATTSPEEMRQAQEEMMRAIERRAETAEARATMAKVFSWLAILAATAAPACFALFLGAVAARFRRPQLQQIAFGFCGYAGLVALWWTLLVFLIRPSSPTLGKIVIAITLLLGLGLYGGLFYLTHHTRRLLPATS